jgi:hypothetical protein
MTRYKLAEKINILVDRQECNFDRACDAAYQIALGRFDCDECGHINGVEDSCRSTDSIVVEFKSCRRSGGMGGQSILYIFEAWVERCDEV